MERIPCHVVELDDKEAFEVSLIENIQRKTMNPIDEATAFKKYVDDYGYGGISELARKIGKSQEYVSRRIQLISLPERVREEVMRRRITPSAAQESASLDDKDASEVVEMIHEQHLPMREVRRIVRYCSQESQRRQGEPCSDLDTPNHPDSLERRMRGIDRALARAVASLKMDMYRLSNVIHDIEDEEDDEWMVRELLFQGRAGLNEQMENLLRMTEERPLGPPSTYAQAHFLMAFDDWRLAQPGKAITGKGSRPRGGAIRTLLRRLREDELTTANKCGCSLSERGLRIYRGIRHVMPRFVVLDKTELTIGSMQVAIVVRGVAEAVSNSIEQRDATIRAGATGATTYVVNGSKFQIPSGSKDCEKDFQSDAWRLREEFEPRNRDVMIVCGSAAELSSKLGAVCAALTLLKSTDATKKESIMHLWL